MAELLALFDYSGGLSRRIQFPWPNAMESELPVLVQKMFRTELQGRDTPLRRRLVRLLLCKQAGEQEICGWTAADESWPQSVVKI